MSRWGTNDMQPEDGRKRRVVLTNRIALVCSAAALVLAFLLASAGPNMAGTFMFLVSVALVVPCFLNRLGKADVASGFLWLVGFVACLSFSILVPGFGLQYGMLVVLSMPFLTFSPDSRAGIYSCACLAIGAFIVLNFGPYAPQPDRSFGAIGFLCPPMMIGIVAFCFLSLLDDNVRAEKRMERALADKADMLVVVSHDINNALASAAGHVEIMQYQLDNGSAVQRTSLDKCASALSSVASITRIARDMQMADGVAVRLEAVDLKLVLDNLLLLFDNTLRSKRLKVEVEIELAAGVEALAERTTLTHSVLGNILSNAIKFSFPDEVIKVTVGWDMTRERIRVRVEDRGIGMPPQVLEAILLDGFRVSRPGTRGETGSGFGLRMAHRFVRRCGGQMNIESRQAAGGGTSGTTVELWLKRA